MKHIKMNQEWFMVNSKAYADAYATTKFSSDVFAHLVLGGLMMVVDPETFAVVIKAESDNELPQLNAAACTCDRPPCVIHPELKQ